MEKESDERRELTAEDFPPVTDENPFINDPHVLQRVMDSNIGAETDWSLPYDSGELCKWFFNTENNNMPYDGEDDEYLRQEAIHNNEIFDDIEDVIRQVDGEEVLEQIKGLSRENDQPHIPALFEAMQIGGGGTQPLFAEEVVECPEPEPVAVVVNEQEKENEVLVGADGGVAAVEAIVESEPAAEEETTIFETEHFILTTKVKLTPWEAKRCKENLVQKLRGMSQEEVTQRLNRIRESKSKPKVEPPPKQNLSVREARLLQIKKGLMLFKKVYPARRNNLNELAKPRILRRGATSSQNDEFFWVVEESEPAQTFISATIGPDHVLDGEEKQEIKQEVKQEVKQEASSPHEISTPSFDDLLKCWEDEAFLFTNFNESVGELGAEALTASQLWKRQMCSGEDEEASPAKREKME